MLSHAWDRNLGGRDLDNVLFNYFANEFKEKYKHKECASVRKMKEYCENVLSKVKEQTINRQRKRANTEPFEEARSSVKTEKVRIKIQT